MEGQKKGSPYLEVFVIAFLIALSFLLPYIIYDKGLFLFFGDYDVQQVPFYMLAHKAIRAGNIFWSWTTDLGSSFIPSYSFYLLGSPFFWLTVPLPDWIVPYMLGPLLALKMAVAALTSFAYINRFARRTEFAALGALLYAFSSYSVYNVFFNHFHEPIAFFPLMLIGLEEFMENDRKGLFVVTVFLNALVNYIFFVGEVIYIILYWILRMTSGEWKLTPKKFAFLAFEAVVGVGLSGVLMVPSVMATLANYRTNQRLTGWYLLLFDNNQRLPDILHSLFFPQDLPSRPNFFPDANNKWASMAAWLPLFSMTGVLAFARSSRGHWLKRLLCVSLVMALIPGLNALFVLLNSEYYARWFYMPVLFMALATVLALEDPAVDLKPGLLWTMVITLGFALTIGLIPKVSAGKVVQIGLEDYPVRFWVYVLIAVGGILLVFLLAERYGKGTAAFANTATVALTAIVCIYGNFFIATGKDYGYDGAWFKSVAVEGAGKIQLDRSSFFRVDVNNGMDNQAMFWNLPTIQAFNSTVSASILEFYPSVGVTRDVASRPQLDLAGLRPFLSVKYLFDYDNLPSLGIPGWVQDSEQLGFKVWRNDNYIPMGYTFDYYMTSAQYQLSSNKDRLLLKALLLSPSQIAKYNDILQAFPDTVTVDFSDNAMAQDASHRRASSCSSFKTDNTGFTAKITLSKKNLVFFTVPYDKGWSATVNGKPAKIEKVDNGFMAVECGTGANTIRFHYYTPGLNAGLAVTGVSLLLLGLYFVWIIRGNRRRRLEVPALPASIDEAYPPAWGPEPPENGGTTGLPHP